MNDGCAGGEEGDARVITLTGCHSEKSEGLTEGGGRGKGKSFTLFVTGTVSSNDPSSPQQTTASSSTPWSTTPTRSVLPSGVLMIFLTCFVRGSLSPNTIRAPPSPMGTTSSRSNIRRFKQRTWRDPPGSAPALLLERQIVL